MLYIFYHNQKLHTMSPKTFEFALTHYQMVSLILINFLKDPDLVRYFIPFLKNADLEDAQTFHSSMRTSMEERWEKTKKLSKERKFHRVNSGVPITCTLPFDGGMWRNSVRLLRMIPYFRKGILRKPRLQNQHNDILLEVSNSIKAVNLIHDDSVWDEKFRATEIYEIRSQKMIQECVDDFVIYEDVYNEYDPIPMNEMPYILICTYNSNNDDNPTLHFNPREEMYIEGIYN
jgi:hypothetical protein